MTPIAKSTYLLYTAIAATAATAYGTYQQGKSAQQQAKTEAAWHAYNARVAKKEAAAESEAAAFEAGQQKRKARQLLARQRTLIGGAGVTMEGSPLLMAEDTAAQLAIENINIRKRGVRRAGAYESMSILDVSKASAAKSAAAGYGRAAGIGAGASILQGVAEAGYMSYRMRASGTKKTT